MVCNSGVGLTPVINGKLHHFGHRGLYNGLSVLGDEQTGSYWDHITGHCISGPLLGCQLDTQPLFHETAQAVVDRLPETVMAISKPSWIGRWMGRICEWKRLSKSGFLPPGFRRTMDSVDPRLPEMTLGLGVWIDRKARFYPLTDIQQSPAGIMDRLTDVELSIMIHPTSRVPVARVAPPDEERAAGNRSTFDGNDNPDSVGQTGARGPSRLMQLFTRWYGFAFTFPNCEVFDRKA